MEQILFQFINTFAMPVRIVEIDANKNPSYCAFNQAALLDSGYTHEEIEGRTAIDLYPGIWGEIAHQRHLAVVKSGQPISYELENSAAEGKHSYRLTLAPILNSDGLVTRIFCTQQDVTAEKLLQVIESDTDIKIRQAEQYIALAAHDLRTPMRHVRLIAGLLKEDFPQLEAEEKGQIQKIEDIASKAMSLISDVLAHARATEKREPALEKFQLTAICSTLVSVLDPLQHNELICDNTSLITDKVALQIAIGNLLDNALKHNNGKGLKLSVSARQISTEFIEITVQDNGQGFGEGAISFIESGKIRTNSGFGLVGVSRLVRERGGDIRVNTKVGIEGVSISFSIPGTILEPTQVAV